MALNSIFAAFAGDRLISRAALNSVAMACRQCMQQDGEERLAVFSDETGRVIDIDLSGSEQQMLNRLSQVTEAPPDTTAGSQPVKRRGPGRPKLGVVSREISLLPRHWQWLAEQRGGASAALRRLVAKAIKEESPTAVAQHAVDAAHRFIWDIAGHRSGFEEATRALFAMDFLSFAQQTAHWPVDIRAQVRRFTDRAEQALAGG